MKKLRIFIGPLCEPEERLFREWDKKKAADHPRQATSDLRLSAPALVSIVLASMNAKEVS
jgi:hypothetical protein